MIFSVVLKGSKWPLSILLINFKQSKVSARLLLWESQTSNFVKRNTNGKILESRHFVGDSSEYVTDTFTTHDFPLPLLSSLQNELLSINAFHFKCFLDVYGHFPLIKSHDLNCLFDIFIDLYEEQFCLAQFMYICRCRINSLPLQQQQSRHLIATRALQTQCLAH